MQTPTTTMPEKESLSFALPTGQDNNIIHITLNSPYYKVTCLFYLHITIRLSIYVWKLINAHIIFRLHRERLAWISM